ncbi:hypothetical protein [Neorhizobium galegae]|uniref:hypothetical protein n=1 Tax=Neorhizobium galegae TaxID=399 RepID=UPI0006227F83|nr:hypothetical protein [Neorhizobium galegae]CDZ27592.1 Hypothetical protein NGAL_HAMBI490_24380 [Neorhizobium galegae bv. officinalis]MCM2498506.1 hypothetical protein [Neorhizobium galegae]MCQ1772338.1 hypothetical protein [Neorhizobium galegae]MCQ1777892.1 hypothetical protein [Neorhizobium galegae]MCQ1795216.1 hypothetical protein [Neorhizobium galegae]
MDTFAILIPVLVAGIQQPRVCAVKGSSQPEDLGWLDPCDKHRDEDGEFSLPSGNDGAAVEVKNGFDHD